MRERTPIFGNILSSSIQLSKENNTTHALFLQQKTKAQNEVNIIAKGVEIS